jgi:drug/metabolite transporter (DMT)-like permease
MSQSSAISLRTKLALVIAMVLWASAFVGIRAGLESYTPGVMALFRFMVASVCMFVIYLFLPKRNRIHIRDIVWLIILGAVTLGIYHVSLNTGEKTIPSGTASFIISQSPVITTLFAVLFLKERPSLLCLGGMAISVVGICIIMFGGSAQVSFDIGAIFVLISAIAGSVYSTLQKIFLKKYHVIEVTAYVIWGATLALLIYLPQLPHEVANASITATLSVIYLGIFPAAIAYVAWSYALAEMPAVRASNFLYFMPLISTLLGWMLLSEIPLWTSLAGGLLALLGLWVVNHSYRRIDKAFIKKRCAL